MRTPPSRITTVRYTQARINQQRRTRIPDKPNKPISLWGVAKNCVGKELTKVSIPINFCEPLSFLQRLTEDFDYSQLLDQAAEEEDDMQLAYVATFAISSYSTTAERISKPFNPLLGETFECDRTEDLGWKSISEQVSHHPPISAIHCEGKNWVVWQHFSMVSKFKGKFIQVEPNGITHLLFPERNNHYTWNKIQTTIHNIILGNLWVEQTGTMIITNHTTGWKGEIEFIPHNYYLKDEQRCIKGTIMNDKEEVKLIISGNWDDKIKISVVLAKGENGGKPTFKTEMPTVIWERNPPIPDSKKFYHFTLLACQLNEMEINVAPTDSRLRPDQRLMEDGKWDEANVLKTSLEERQRNRRAAGKENKPVWFDIKNDPVTGEPIYTFNGTYWDCKADQNWSKCPNLFNLSVED